MTWHDMMWNDAYTAGSSKEFRMQDVKWYETIWNEMVWYDNDMTVYTLRALHALHAW
jgi:hypothetical protein